MNREVADATEIPHVFLIHLNSNQVRHDFGESVVMVPFYPHHLDATLGIR